MSIKLKMYKRLELRMFWVHFDSIEPKVQHELCHCYAAINITHHFFLHGVLIFVASYLDNNGFMLSYI